MTIANKSIVEGGIKGVIDDFTDKVSASATKSLVHSLNIESPSMESLVEEGVKFLTLITIAEYLPEIKDIISPIISSSSEGGDEKIRLLQVLFRNYAGERIGDALSDKAVDILPKAFSLFKDVKIDDLREAVNLINEGQN